MRIGKKLEEEKMIPKKIHYSWFGCGEKPNIAKKCIASWKEFCPDYEIIEWNETNVDIRGNPYMEMCYDNKKYAFLSDYVRLVIVEKYGGIYLDTDVELLSSIDPLLVNQGYVGFETVSYVNTGMGFGSVAHGKMVRMMLSEYDKLLDGKHGVIGCPILNTEALLKLGMKQDGTYQKLVDCTIYPIEWFNPYDDPTGTLNQTDNTMSIHWYSKTWMSKSAVFRSYCTKPIHRLQKKLNEFQHRQEF